MLTRCNAILLLRNYTTSHNYPHEREELQYHSQQHIKYTSFIVYMELKYCCPVLRALPDASRRSQLAKIHMRGFIYFHMRSFMWRASYTVKKIGASLFLPLFPTFSHFLPILHIKVSYIYYYRTSRGSPTVPSHTVLLTTCTVPITPYVSGLFHSTISHRTSHNSYRNSNTVLLRALSQYHLTPPYFSQLVPYLSHRTS